jgi:SpoIID/LytB domain protein
MSRALRAVAGALLAAAAVVPVAPAAATTPPPQTVNISAGQLHLVVTYRGNGHGHGMSQYGAFGAAKQGLTFPKILAFYYPGTKLAVAPAVARMRVLITAAGSTATLAAESNLVVSGSSTVLPTTNIRKYRLVVNPANSSGLLLQKLPSTTGATWHNVKALPDNAEFHRVGYPSMRLYLPGGASTRYYGVLRATRISSTRVETINRVTYDKYAQGVAPQEVPASWPRAAVDAQAVAARTYGDYAAHHPANPNYDICDTSMCQVYGGHAHYDASGKIVYTDFAPAATDTSNQVLQYAGAPVFAQFSASNGGWTVDGGQPYLVAEQDPYDTAPTDPYIDAKKTITVASLASAFGLAKITSLTISRDGHGTFGGRVLSVVAHNGTTAKTQDGSFLQGALGLGTTWIQLTPAA